jgi:GTPase
LAKNQHDFKLFSRNCNRNQGALMSKAILAKVVIVGRTNVGKSTLFNRLSTKVKSLTYDYHGVTRDFIQDTVCWQGHCFDLIDTGGISLQMQGDPLLQAARQRALEQMEKADVLLFVCDGIVGLLPEDRDIAQQIYKLGKQAAVVVNKIDTDRAKEQQFEFQKLGFKDIITISAQHGTGIADLLEFIVHSLPHEKMVEVEQPHCRVVIFGRPNVGKSSLLNLFLKQERALVANIPGTTREAITERIRFYKEDIQVTDTPGLRRQRSIHEPLEGLMVKSAMRALDEADIVLLLVDTPQGTIADQELKLAFYSFKERNKALIILFNKNDLCSDDYAKKTMGMTLDSYRYFLKKIPSLYISCKTGENIGKILPLVNDVWQRYSQKFSDEDLFRLFRTALEKTPLFRSERQLHVYNAHQIKSAPIIIALYVNEPRYFGESQIGFFENLLRKEYSLIGVPVKWVVRKNIPK